MEKDRFSPTLRYPAAGWIPDRKILFSDRDGIYGTISRLMANGWRRTSSPLCISGERGSRKVEEKTDLTVTVFEIETAIAFLYFQRKTV